MVNLASGAMVQDELLFLGTAADLRSQKALLLLLCWEDAPQNSPESTGQRSRGLDAAQGLRQYAMACVSRGKLLHDLLVAI